LFCNKTTTILFNINLFFPYHKQNEIAAALEENGELAKVYVQLQNEHIDKKNVFISSYEKSLIAQDSLADKENVSCTLIDLYAG